MQDPLAFVIAIAHIAAAIALLNGVLTTFGQAKIAAQAIESIARQPEAEDSIRTTMFVGLALAETSGIYGLLIAIIMLFANPLIDILINYLG
ncbi:ATP synthase F0 subunit C [Amphibacillus sp. MSJ-3]|uniref:ATP synthase F0 subunit C n=1 Tax=Amphibacillus sp. MSJ-3 TaxID=2841505 RepID=UPI001C0F10A2|nr:ATP synthase F0 subunit C [Amphibacillus sp. MSJ-3]MBU5595469.1 ATP synthase F0 subunit C [Amphibacillus sp. MSJ-3]